MSVEFYNFMPFITDDPEPSLGNIVFEYYSNHFETKKAKELTENYFKLVLTEYVVYNRDEICKAVNQITLKEDLI